MNDPDALISTEALARQLGRDDLRIYDCTTYLDPAPPESEEPYIVRPGRDSFEAALLACFGALGMAPHVWQGRPSFTLQQDA